VALCVSCGKELCAECRLKLAGKNYCQDCADKLVAGKSEPSEKSEKRDSTESFHRRPMARETLKDKYVEKESHSNRKNQSINEIPKKSHGSNRILIFCIAFVLALFIIGLVLYVVYLIYLAPHYGDLQNLMQILSSDPQSVLNYLNQ
jgi:hypothetical protein